MSEYDQAHHKRWIERKFLDDYPIGGTEEIYYAATQKAKKSFEQSDFWQSLKNLLNEWQGEYSNRNGANLFSGAPKFEIVIKPFESTLDKCFRHNVLNNSGYPEIEPDGGWYEPDNWFEQIHDILRTQVTVKYMDGVTFLVEKLEELCVSCGLTNVCDFEAKPEGYYAVHFYIDEIVSIPISIKTNREITMRLEVQIFTQLQEVIRDQTHQAYTELRSQRSSTSKWQWNYTDRNFEQNYLGHLLHYVDGMVMKIREGRE